MMEEEEHGDEGIFQTYILALFQIQHDNFSISRSFVFHYFLVMDYDKYEGGVAMTSDVLARRRHKTEKE